MKILIKTRHFKQISILIIIGIFFVYCNISDYSSSIDLTKNHSVSVFDVFSDVKAIKLETSEDCLISEINRIQYYDSRYYILDARSQQIFCFDENGSFEYKINAQGRGKGEYHYITDFAIDEKNKQMVVLDPVVQRVHFFDLNGNFISSHDIKSDKVFGLFRVYPLQDSLLLLTSLTYESLLFYSLKKEKIVYADFNFNEPSGLHAFSPLDNVYFFDDKVLFLVPLSQEVVDVTSMVPETHFIWCFGSNNNSAQQVNRLLDEIRMKEKLGEGFSVSAQAVGKDKILNHHIMKSFENRRFRIAMIEFDNDIKFVLIDKNYNQTFVFKSFTEGIRLPFHTVQADRAIIFHIPEFGPKDIDAIKSAGLEDYYFGRNRTFYTAEILHEDCRHIVENHDPMTDNPFLVVYKFKE